jgi:hypothetical protein
LTGFSTPLVVSQWTAKTWVIAWSRGQRLLDAGGIGRRVLGVSSTTRGRAGDLENLDHARWP